MTWHYLASERMTVAVGVDDNGIVRHAPPIVWLFRGQPLRSLVAWMSKQPGFRHELLPERPGGDT